MAGGSPRHNFLSTAAGAELRAAVRGRGCHVLSSDQRISAKQGARYVYADAVVVCGGVQTEPDAGDVLSNPTAIVEVLSRSTEAFDRGENWEGYQRLLPDGLPARLTMARAYRALSTQGTAPGGIACSSGAIGSPWRTAPRSRSMPSTTVPSSRSRLTSQSFTAGGRMWQHGAGGDPTLRLGIDFGTADRGRVLRSRELPCRQLPGRGGGHRGFLPLRGRRAAGSSGSASTPSRSPRTPSGRCSGRSSACSPARARRPTSRSRSAGRSSGCSIS